MVAAARGPWRGAPGYPGTKEARLGDVEGGGTALETMDALAKVSDRYALTPTR
ncbi:MAG: hypothetical protein ACLUW6_06050 [Coriobacteriaceae bacterium]